MQKPANVDDSLTDYNLAGNSRPFMDSVSGMHWMPATQNNQYPGNMVAVTTWDGSLRVLEVVPNGGSGTIQEKYYIDNLSPITCFTWNSDTNTSITFGCVDGSIKNLDLTNNSITQIGKCNDIVHSVHYIPSSNTILSVGYDKILNFWQRNNPQPVFSQTNNSKIYVSDYSNGIFAAGTDDEKIMIFDVANMNNFPKPSVSESYLQKKSQLSCMSLSHDASLVSYGSIDGRGNVSSIKKGGFSSGHSLSSEIIFKANKYTINSVNYVYPVNAIGLNVKNQKWVFTGASDGTLQFWNFDGKSQIKSMSFNKTPVTHAKVNATGDLIIYALGDDWHQGPKGKGKWATKLACHRILDSEVKFALKLK